MTFFLKWGGGLELGGTALGKEKGPNGVLDGTLLLKLGLDSTGLSNLVKICLPGDKKLGPNPRMWD
jgi:hypothetical protein